MESGATSARELLDCSPKGYNRNIFFFFWETVVAIRQKIPGPGGQSVDAELIEITTSNEKSNTYELADGSVLSLKTVVTEIWRVEGHYDEQGNPMYITRSTNMATVNSPEGLRRRMS